MTKAQTTLSTKQRDLEDDADKALTMFTTLSAEQKQRHLATIQSIMMDGVNEELDWPTVAEFLSEGEIEDQLQAQLEEAGFSRDTQEKLADIFFQTIEERLAHDPFRQGLRELLNNYLPPSPFISDEELDLVELLGNRINELQDQIAFVEQESEQIRQELHDNEKCNEALDLPRSPKKSSLNEFLNEPTNEENAFNEEQQVGDARMRNYLRYFGSAN
jgi:hypothetical protein